MISGKQEPIGLYIHIPFCVSKCRYCDFPSFSGMQEYFDDYAEAMCREMKMIRERHGTLPVDTVYCGGGTPSLLSVEQITKIINTMSEMFIIKKNSEITIEANPGTVTAEKAKAYRELSFNRISIGLQAAQNKLLRFMGRIHTADMFINCIDLVKDYGFYNINADIIFGIPTQTMEDWNKTLQIIGKIDITHVSCYSLKLEENTLWYDMDRKGILPPVDDILEREMCYRAVSSLEQSGFYQYEVSNFSKPGFESKHNSKYWSGLPYIGIGAAAHSFMGNVRTANITNPIEYIQCIKKDNLPQAIGNEVGFEERLSERLILGLRFIKGVSLDQLLQEFGWKALSGHIQKIELLKKRNLVSVDGGMLKLTRKGLDYANQVWMEFL